MIAAAGGRELMIRSILHTFNAFYKRPSESKEGVLERVAESDGDTSCSGSRVTSTGSGRRSAGSFMPSGYVSVQDEQDEQDLQAMCSYLAHLPPHIAPTWESSDTALAELRAAHVEVFASPERAALKSAVAHLEAFGVEYSAVKRVAAHMSHIYLTERETISGRISSAENSRRLLRNSRHSSEGSAGSAGGGGGAEEGEKRVTFSTMLAQHLTSACVPTSRTSARRLEEQLARNLTSRAVVLALLAVLHAARSEEARQLERDVVRELARVYDEQAGNDRAYVTYAAVKRALLAKLPAPAVRAHKCLVRGVLLICMHIQSEEVLPGSCPERDDEGRTASGDSRGSGGSGGFVAGSGGGASASGAAFRGSRERAFVAAAIDVLQAHGLRFFLPACAVSKGAVAKSVHVSAARDGTPLNATCGRVVVLGAARPVLLFAQRDSASALRDGDVAEAKSLAAALGHSAASRASAFRVAVSKRGDGTIAALRVGGDVLDEAVGHTVARQLAAAEGSDEVPLSAAAAASAAEAETAAAERGGGDRGG